MPGSTTNFGFEYPLNTDPLADGAQEIQNFAETADTTFADLLGGTTDQLLAKNSNTDMDFKWVASPTFPAGGTFAVPSLNYFGARTSQNYSDDPNTNAVYQRLYFIPVIVPDAITVDRIAVECTTAVAAQVARLGIYNADANGLPSTLLLDAGTVSVGTTGIKTITISQALTSQPYYLAIVTQTTSGTSAYTGLIAADVAPAAYTSSIRFLSYTSATDYFNGKAKYFTQNTVTGALPATATPVAVNGASMIDIGLRRS